MAAAKKVKPQAAARHNALLWWGGLGCGGVLMLSPGSALLLSALLAPVLLLAMLPEEGQGRQTIQAGLLFGLAAGLHPLRALWEGGGSIGVSLVLARQPAVLLMAWTAVAASWFIGEVACVTLRLAADLTAAAKRRDLTAAVAKLEEEWGSLAPPT